MTYTKQYEDSYSGTEFETGAELLAHLEHWSTGSLGDLNVPVWISILEADAYEDGETIPAKLEVGTFLPRHGRCTIRYTVDFTAEDVTAIRRLFMQVWAGRADAGFDRHPSFMRETAPAIGA